MRLTRNSIKYSQKTVFFLSIYDSMRFIDQSKANWSWRESIHPIIEQGMEMGRKDDSDLSGKPWNRKRGGQLKAWGL